MDNLDKIFNDWDEDETLYQDWYIFEIGDTYYIKTDTISDKRIILHNNYSYTKSSLSSASVIGQFDKELSINEIRKIIEEGKDIYYNLHPATQADHCTFENLPEEIKERIKC